MGLLVVMRHAKSEYPPGVSDHDRPLAPRGRREAPLMAPLLVSDIGDVRAVRALVSSAARARQTWDAVCASLPLSIPSRVVPDLYESSPAEMARCIRETVELETPIPETLVVVAHNPGVHAAVIEWTGAGPERFPTSAFAVMEYDAAWNDFPSGPVRLRSFHIAR